MPTETNKKTVIPKIAWWPFYLTLASILILAFILLTAYLIRNNDLGFFLNDMSYILLAVCLAAIVTGIAALAKRVRSWPVWVGLIPAVLIFVLAVFMNIVIIVN